MPPRTDGSDLPDYAPVPNSALGPAVNEQGYYVGRVERNLYWVTEVGALFDAAGFFPIDIGALASGGSMQQWGGALAGHNLVRIPAPWE
jgi:hypothetical protein